MQGSGQHAVGAGLPAKRLTHQHEAVPHGHHLEDLQDLLDEEVRHLEVHELAVLPDGFQQHLVVGLRQLDPREEVRGDALGSGVGERESGRKIS